MKIIHVILLLGVVGQVKMQIIDFKYATKRNIEIDLDFNKIFLLDSFRVNRELFCIAKCNKIDTCVSCAYTGDKSTGLNCFLYNRRITTTFSNGVMNLFNKLCPNGKMQSFDTKCFSLKAIFDKGLPPVQIMQNDPLIVYPMEFYIMPYIPHTYYITNIYANCVSLYDRHFQYQSCISITTPREIRLINNFTYILTTDGFRKFDYNMQLVIFVANINPCKFLRMHYSEKYNMFYISNDCVNKIDLFDLNLSYLGNITLNNQKSFAFKEYNNKLYVSTFDRTIFVIQNRTIVGNYTNICLSAGEIRGICIDYEGYMAVTCSNDHSVFLYHINGTNINKTIKTPGLTYWAKFELSGYLVIADADINTIYLYK